MGDLPHFNNSNTKGFKNKFDQTVAGSAWLNTRNKDDPQRTAKIKEIHDLLLKYEMQLYVVVKDTNGSERYTDHTDLTALTLFAQGERQEYHKEQAEKIFGGNDDTEVDF
tara:strand:- start:205 stop:534 length:330 start_codon:yes stop_codon:yes gene_type:complete